MNRHFAAIQQTIAGTPALADVRLLTVTLDPDFDRPAILKAYARRVGGSGHLDVPHRRTRRCRDFVSQFGIVQRAQSSERLDITHNLRTAVIDADGRLVTAHTGNRWTPDELVADLTAAPAPAH